MIRIFAVMSFAAVLAAAIAPSVYTYNAIV